MKFYFSWILLLIPIFLFGVHEEIFSDGKGYEIIFIKDDQDRVIKKTIVDEKKEIFLEELKYDISGNLLEVKDGFYRDEAWKIQSINMSYNDANQLTEVIRNSGSKNERKISCKYDEDGSLFEKINSDGVKIYYDHDVSENCHVHSSDNSIDYVLTYNEYGYLIQAEDRVHHQILFREIDEYGNITKEIFPNGEEIEITYDDEDRPQIIKGPKIGEIQYEYNEDDLINVKRRSNSGEVQYSHAYQYDNTENVIKEDLIGELGQIVYERDIHKRMVTITSPYSLEKCCYDAIGNLIFRKRDGIEFYYKYDPLFHLINSDEYDVIHNPINAKVNDLNELLEYDDISCEYDLNGNLVAKHTPEKSYFFAYDALGRLIRVNSENLEVCFSYDPLGRRMSKSAFQNGKKTTETYLYQNKNEIACFRNGELKELRIPGKSFHEEVAKAIAIEMNGKVYAPIYDVQCNLFKMIDIESKEIMEIGLIDPFGSNLKEISKEKWSSWIFSSKRYDSEADLVYFGHRYYDPKLKRWITADPLFFINGINFYNYVFNNPFRYIDPNGEFVFVVPIAVWGGITLGELAMTAAAATVAAWAGHEIGNVLDKKMEEKKWKNRENDKQHKGCPGPNDKQNKQFKDSKKQIEKHIGRKLSKDEKRKIHDAIHGQDYGYWEIVEEGINIIKKIRKRYE